jgi:myo-inositol-1(or 4)-monophosphatase
MNDMSEAFALHYQNSVARLAHPMASVALSAAKRGGDALLQHYDRDVEVQTKGVANFVSAADLAAESAIVATLQEAYPDHAILSEESHRDRADAEHVWIIDPLDGTNNFLHRIPHFAVSIGYYARGVGELGIVCNPVSGEWFVAARGQGAWCNGERMQVSRAKGLSDSMVACGFYYDRGRMMHATLATLADLFQADIHGMRRMGAAALDLAYVACGRFEAFFEYRLSPWDIAAGGVLLSEAGGRMTDCDGKGISLVKASSVCASNGSVHAAMLEKISGHWSALTRAGHIP